MCLEPPGKSYLEASVACSRKRTENRTCESGARKNAEQEAFIGKRCSGRGVFGELFGPVISGVPGPPGARKNAEQERFIGKRCSGRGVFRERAVSQGRVGVAQSLSQISVINHTVAILAQDRDSSATPAFENVMSLMGLSRGPIGPLMPS